MTLVPTFSVARYCECC